MKTPMPLVALTCLAALFGCDAFPEEPAGDADLAVVSRPLYDWQPIKPPSYELLCGNEYQRCCRAGVACWDSGDVCNLGRCLTPSPTTGWINSVTPCFTGPRVKVQDQISIARIAFYGFPSDVESPPCTPLMKPPAAAWDQVDRLEYSVVHVGYPAEVGALREFDTAAQLEDGRYYIAKIQGYQQDVYDPETAGNETPPGGGLCIQVTANACDLL